jgi:hypothetical protein
MKDEVIEFKEEDTRKDYPNKLRRVAVYDDKQDCTIIILTNNFSCTAVK